jgi:hypothetical protein
MPSGWWHTARILSPSITISINGANAVSWPDFRKDFCRYYTSGRKLPPQFFNVYLLFVGNVYLLFVGEWLSLFASC